MRSVLLKTVVKRPLTVHRPGITTTVVSLDDTIQNYLSCFYHTETNAQTADDRVFPVYIHHVSKIVLQHLQDSRSEWLVEQGLNGGLHINSNGTFMLSFPSNKRGLDGGKVWTSYDPNTRQHWLSVYRQQFNAKFLLKEAKCKLTGAQKMRNIQMTIQDHKTVEDRIRLVVDQMVRQVPPNIILANTKEEKEERKVD